MELALEDAPPCAKDVSYSLNLRPPVFCPREPSPPSCGAPAAALLEDGQLVTEQLLRLVASQNDTIALLVARLDWLGVQEERLQHLGEALAQLAQLQASHVALAERLEAVKEEQAWATQRTVGAAMADLSSNVVELVLEPVLAALPGVVRRVLGAVRPLPSPLLARPAVAPRRPAGREMGCNAFWATAREVRARLPHLREPPRWTVVLALCDFSAGCHFKYQYKYGNYKFLEAGAVFRASLEVATNFAVFFFEETFSAFWADAAGGQRLVDFA